MIWVDVYDEIRLVADATLFSKPKKQHQKSGNGELHIFPFFS